MAAPLGGLTGLYGPVEQPHGTTGRPVTDWGVPVDPRHATPGDSSHERPYAGTSYGQDGIPVGHVEGVPDPGFVLDHTPVSHAAPYPRGASQDPLVAAEQLRELHGLDKGAPAVQAHTGTPYRTHVDVGFYDSPNRSALAATPGQIRSGSDDVDQGYGTENGHGFQYGHQFRRWFHDNIPLDRTGVISSERPFWGKHPSAWQARFDGEDSPFAAYGDTSTGMAMSDTPTGTPTPYEQPPDPAVQASVGYAAEAPISDYGWVQT
jgi:hypothetical protein